MSALPLWNELTAVVGGRFDPPHLGHIEAVHGILREPGFKRVVMLPSGTPAYKPTVASAADRLEMTRIAFSKIDRVTVNTLEIDRKGPSFTIDTLPELKKEYGPLAFVIGTDQLESLDQWHRFPEVLSLCHWFILQRKGGPSKPEEVLQKWSGGAFARPHSDRIWSLQNGTFLRIEETPAKALSSTQIRESIAKSGAPSPNSLSSEVLSYLKTRRIYGT